jgi:hypothetical protein
MTLEEFSAFDTTTTTGHGKSLLEGWGLRPTPPPRVTATISAAAIYLCPACSASSRSPSLDELRDDAGVRPEIAARVLGHVQPGVESVYDRHSYFEEKADALTALANLLQSILGP